MPRGRGIRTTVAVAVLLVIGIILWAGVRLPLFGWVFVVGAVASMLFSIYADWRA